ncbi:MAG: ABC transporter ATP-binding protein [Dongiaceae bacterium]
MLKIENLTCGYGAIQALDNVCLEVPQGKIVTLIGANGAGKSTLLMSLFGRPRAWEGRIVFKEKDITRLSADRIARLGLAQVPEGRRIFSKLTVLENLQLGSRLAPEKNYKNNLEKTLNLFPRLAERLHKRGGTLSGGEQQMLAIGRALMGEPEFLCLDEPSLGLAPLIVKQIFEILRQLNQELGATILLVEQNAALALQLADHAYVLVNGRVTLQGKAGDLLANSQVRQAYLYG